MLHEQLNDMNVVSGRPQFSESEENGNSARMDLTTEAGGHELTILFGAHDSRVGCACP